MTGSLPLELHNCIAMAKAARIPVRSTAARALLCVMAAHCDQSGVVQLSQAEMASLSMLTTRSISTELLAMEGGLIRRDKGGGMGRGKGRRPDKITILFLAECVSACNDFSEIASGRREFAQKEIAEKSTLRGVTSPAPRARGLDKPLEVSSLFGSYEPQREQRSLAPPKPKKGRGGKREYSADFEVIWKIWPAAIRANSDKRVAFERWISACDHHSREAILAAAQRYLAATSVSDAQGGPWKPRTCLAEVFFTKKLESSLEAVAEAATQPARKVWSPEAGAFVEERPL